MATDLTSHSTLVSHLSAQIRTLHSSRQPFRISHGSTNSTRSRTPSSSSSPSLPTISTAPLNRILSINPHTHTCLCEPNVPMDALLSATLPHGLIPPVVMEFPGITVGGGFSGTSGESSSWREGFFDRCVEWVEIVLGDGRVVRAEREGEREDLFRGAAGGLGTLGVVTLLEVRLREAGRWVEVGYRSVGGAEEAVRMVKEITSERERVDYVDGILFARDRGVVITGRMTDEAEKGLEVQRFSRARDPWFYVHAEKMAYKSTRTSARELVPIADYLLRYDRGAFWCGRTGFRYFMVPFNRITRWLVDPFVRTRMMYKALHASEYANEFIVQDLALPYSTATAFLQYVDEAFRIYPLWLCPLKQSPMPTLHPHCSDMENDKITPKPMLNIGLWGLGPHDRKAFAALNRHLESTLKELGGMKWLYARTFYDEDEFWEMFDRTWYDGLRGKYHATLLPSVYDKVKAPKNYQGGDASLSWRIAVLSMWPFAGLWGIWKAILSREWLAQRQVATPSPIEKSSEPP
ncbi:MAG: hypothetical protein Q9227_002120 [Pyrenula ochraceoflavens]